LTQGRAGSVLRALCLLPFAFQLFLFPVQTVNAANSTVAAAMQAAAQTRHVPLPLIEATAYVNTRWEWIATPAQDGGVGPMNIRPSQLSQASFLSGHSQSQIASDLVDNLDAGAALLAHYHTSGTNLASWRSAVVTTQGSFVATQIYDVLGTGATRTTSTGETITLAAQTIASTGSSSTGSAGGASLSAGTAAASTCSATSPDYPPACWVPADPSNYSVAKRAHDYPIDMIIIHDIEGSYGSAIQDFQTPGFAASAHYVVSYGGDITQMVREKNIAWHAGNWDYNTRAIGIEHEGYAAYDLYTRAEYQASAALAASICSRWGVPMDRTHVIGHYQVPDPNNPGLFGGVGHHTDPGPYWNWTYYMQQAQNDTQSLPSPPHMMPDPVAVNGATGATVTWQPARTCRAAAAPITGYTVVAQPGGATMTLPATATSATLTGLQEGTRYTLSVTATNSYGTDTATSNSVIVGACTAVNVTASPSSPQLSGTSVQLTASAATCPNPLYHFSILAPGATSYEIAQDYSTSPTFSWITAGLAPGGYRFSVWARDAISPGYAGNSSGAWDTYDNNTVYSVTSLPCSVVSISNSPSSPSGVGTAVTISAQASGCPNPSYRFSVRAPGATSYQLVQDYSTSATYGWNTNGLIPGVYRFSIWARDPTSWGTYGNSSGRWDAYNNDTLYSLNSCSAVSASVSPVSPAGVGTAVNVTANASGCPDPNPLYQFFVLAPGSSSYQLAQAYSTSPSFSWNTTGMVPESYRFSVWVKDANSAGAFGNSSGTWDAYNNNATYSLSSCSALSVTVSPASPSTAGTTVTVNASASGCPDLKPLYQFSVLAPGSSAYQLVQAYSTSSTFSWNTTGMAAGQYRFSLWAKDANSAGAFGNSSGRWDTYNNNSVYSLG
jgi:N-acetylmuramoyl-L-alanine amidase/Fibronectin type III domain